jgi:hypothetical protein
LVNVERKVVFGKISVFIGPIYVYVYRNFILN